MAKVDMTEEVKNEVRLIEDEIALILSPFDGSDVPMQDQYVVLCIVLCAQIRVRLSRLEAKT